MMSIIAKTLYGEAFFQISLQIVNARKQIAVIENAIAAIVSSAVPPIGSKKMSTAQQIVASAANNPVSFKYFISKSLFSAKSFKVFPKI